LGKEGGKRWSNHSKTHKKNRKTANARISMGRTRRKFWQGGVPMTGKRKGREKKGSIDQGERKWKQREVFCGGWRNELKVAEQGRQNEGGGGVGRKSRFEGGRRI